MDSSLSRERSNSCVLDSARVLLRSSGISHSPSGFSLQEFESDHQNPILISTDGNMALHVLTFCTHISSQLLLAVWKDQGTRSSRRIVSRKEVVHESTIKCSLEETFPSKQENSTKSLPTVEQANRMFDPMSCTSAISISKSMDNSLAAVLLLLPYSMVLENLLPECSTLKHLVC